MLDLTEAQQKIFYTGTYFHGYKMHFPNLGLTIDNDTIHSEAVTIKESICDEEEFVLGGCIAASCEFEVSEILQNELNGHEFTAMLETVDEDGNSALELSMGTYRVDSATLVNDKDYKKVVAYDALYGASADVSEWYNGIFPAEEKSVTKLQDGKEVTVKIVEYGTVKLKAMRESLLKYLGIPFESQDLINDDMDVEKTVAPAAGSLTGITVLKAICTVNGGFGRMSRQGKFEVIYLHDMHSLGLQPHVGLYPKKGLYPSSSGNGLSDISKLSGAADTEPEYQSIRCEEYTTDKITCLNIQTDEEDVGVTVGTDLSNPYLITGNFLLYGKSVDELKVIGGNILSKLKGIYYRPVSELKLNALPYLETGDMIVAEKEAEKVYSYIFSRTISGIQALIDTYEAKGNQKRQNEVTQESELMQLKGRTLKIQKNIDSVYIEMTNVEKKTSTRFEQTDSTIVLKVDSDGRLAEVALGDDPDTAKTYFRVKANNLDLEAEDVFNIISGGTLNLSGKKITIVSDKFNVTEDGTVQAESIDISGGRIHLETVNSPDSLLKLSNYKPKVIANGEELEVKYIGNGKPKDELTIPDGTVEIEGPAIGDLYYDLDTDTVYRFYYGNGAHWMEYDYEENLDQKPTCDYNSTAMNTEEGVSSECYTTVTLDVEDGKGGYVKRQFKDSSKTIHNPYGVHLEKTSYTTRAGTVEEETIAANLTLTEEYDGELHKQPVIKSSAPFKIQNVKIDGSDGEKLSIPSAVSCTGLMINGMRYMSGTQVFTTDGIRTYTVIDVPDINGFMPFTAANADWDACPFTIDGFALSLNGTSGTPQIVISHSAIDQGATYRVNYSYWANA